jgi:PEP-CTERM putative exosortase interaction domain
MIRTLAVIASALSLAGVAGAQQITSFTNLDFDLGVVNVASGFDNPGADIPGWRNYTPITDSGVEGPGAWWNPYQEYAAWMKNGEGAYNLSDYTIQSGDLFSVSFFAQWWQWSGSEGKWTVSLFYDDPANVIGSYTTPNLADHGNWTSYSSANIAATPESVGGKLGILFFNSGTGIAQVDEITVNLVPEPSSFSLLGLAAAGFFLRSRRSVK